MKRTNFKSAGTVCLAALLFSLTSALGSKRFTLARYKETGLQTCFNPQTMPEGCTTINTGTLCTSTSGSITRTWYQGASCVIPYYRFAE
jgi:hypothetical protein